MIKACKGVFFIVLRADGQHYACILHKSEILLKFGIDLSHMGFLSDFDAVNTVISDNSAP